MWWMVVAAVTAACVIVLNRKQPLPSLQLPVPRWLPVSPLPSAIRILSLVLHIAALGFLSWTFVHCLVGSGPLESYFLSPTYAQPHPADSRAFFFVVDRSGSMAEPMPTNPRQSKVQMVTASIEQCRALMDQEGGENDFLGLITFARAANIDVPLSRDREFFHEQVQKIVPETEERLNGTAIGYAIMKSVALITACRAFAGVNPSAQKGTVPIGSTILLITDGIEEPHPADRADPFRSMRTYQALDYAREHNVQVHYVNVDKHSYQQLSPEERDRLIDAIEATGGRYFEISIGQPLSQVMKQIAQSVEARPTPPPIENRAQMGFWLIALALMAAAGSRLVESVGMRVAR